MQLVGRGIGKAEDDLIEVFVELLGRRGVGVREDDEIVPFLGRGRGDVQVALALEDRARDFAVDRGVESEAATAEGELGGIALEHEVFDGDGFAGRRQPAQLLIGGVGVGRALREEWVRRDPSGGEKYKKRQSSAKVHRSALLSEYCFAINIVENRG